MLIGNGYSLEEDDRGRYPSSGLLRPVCPTSPIIREFRKTSVFYGKFLTEVEPKNFRKDLLEINCSPDNEYYYICSRWRVAFHEWVFSEKTSGSMVSKVSTLIELRTDLPPGQDEAAAVWIKFGITTYLRLGQSTGRTGNDFSSALTHAISIDLDVIGRIQAELELPEGVVWAETTSVEEKIELLLTGGEKSGSCLVDGGSCLVQCESGYYQGTDGSCVSQPLTLPVIPADCYDGDNGGCSHFCIQHESRCACPTCWALQGDHKSCLPETDKIWTTCGHNGMTIEVDKCVYTDGTDAVTIGFGTDPNCLSIENNGTLSVTTALDECGVTTTTNDGTIIFSNSLIVAERIHPLGIVLKTDVDINVQCSFNVAVTGINSKVNVSSPVHTSGTSGTGEFAFLANYYNSDAFETVSNDNDTVIVGETLHYGIKPTTLVKDVLFFVNDCEVTDHNGNSYSIFQNMCPNTIVTRGTSTFISTDLFTLNYQAFKFAGLFDSQIRVNF